MPEGPRGDFSSFWSCYERGQWQIQREDQGFKVDKKLSSVKKLAQAPNLQPTTVF